MIDREHNRQFSLFFSGRRRYWGNQPVRSDPIRHRSFAEWTTSPGSRKFRGILQKSDFKGRQTLAQHDGVQLMCGSGDVSPQWQQQQKDLGELMMRPAGQTEHLVCDCGAESDPVLQLHFRRNDSLSSFLLCAITELICGIIKLEAASFLFLSKEKHGELKRLFVVFPLLLYLWFYSSHGFKV